MIKKEAIGAKPYYCVGDIVTNSYGGKGVIVDAETVVLNERPQYAVKWITGFQNGVGWADTRQWKYAWWEAHEWADVELGLVHSKQEKKNGEQEKSISKLRQNLPENVQGPNVMGGDDGSGKSNAVIDAYNLYEERERQAWARLLGGS